MVLTTGIPYREGKGREGAIVLDDNHGKIMSFLVQLVLHLLIGNYDWKRLIGGRKPRFILLSTSRY